MSENLNKFKQTLCWDCKKAIGECSWSAILRPVEGWKATPTKRVSANGEVHSFRVEECPEFERDAFCNGLKRLGEYEDDTERQSIRMDAALRKNNSAGRNEGIWMHAFSGKNSRPGD